jgi:GT2 family glycosyltransferase
MTGQPAAPDGALLVLAVLTRDRLGPLMRCLASIAGDAAPRDVRIELVVVDNGSGQPALACNRASVSWAAAAFPARLVVEETPGISSARNRALDEADKLLADAVVFLDDDQTIPPGWLAALVGAWREEAADVVKPVVRWAFEPPAQLRDHFRTLPGYGPARETVLHPVATNGVLVSARLWREFGLRFDPGLDLSGGEDTLFFEQALRRGARIVLTRETHAVEHCPAHRQTAAWLLRRAFRVGAVEAASGIKLRSTTGHLTRGIATILSRGFLALVTIARPVRSFRHLMRCFKAAGRIAGAFGHTLAEYRTV